METCEQNQSPQPEMQLSNGSPDEDANSKRKHFRKRASSQLTRLLSSGIDKRADSLGDRPTAAELLCLAAAILLALGLLSLPIIFHFIVVKVRVLLSNFINIYILLKVDKKSLYINIVAKFYKICIVINVLDSTYKHINNCDQNSIEIIIYTNHF